MTTALARAQNPDGTWQPAVDHGGSLVYDTYAQPPSIRRDFDPINKFQGVHACLIPTGSHQGHVLVWNHLHYEGGNYQTEQRVLHYSIVDPTQNPPVFYNHILGPLPLGEGDLFCCGQAWNAIGHLVVAGGTTQHPTWPDPWGGARLVYVWEPPTGIGAPGTWHFPKQGAIQLYLEYHRWYPSVIALCPNAMDPSQDRMLILGGTHRQYDQQNQKWVWIAQNSYEAWEEGANPGGRLQSIGSPPVRTWLGPQNNSDFVLRDYPRAHTLSNNSIATAGFVRGSCRGAHPVSAPTAWFTKNFSWFMDSGWRYLGSSVLLPISIAGGFKDQIFAIGGVSPGQPLVLDTTEICDALAANPEWQPQLPLNHKRHVLNTVLLPDGSVLAVGGEKQYTGLNCSEVPALVPELYSAGAWTPLEAAPSPIIRDYHSCALLLPDASVLVCGGESRHHNPATACPTKGSQHANPADYSIFEPPYLTSGSTRPSIVNAPAQGGHWVWPYTTTQSLTSAALPLGVSISKITLLRAGAVTHHADTNQRCVELAFQVVGETPEGEQAIDVTVPTRAANLLPRGFYMLFLVTSQGAPSNAAWVKIQ